MPNKRVIQDRRQSRRKSFVIRVNYRTVDEVFSDFSENINEGGMFIVTTKRHESGSQVRLDFMLPTSDAPVRVNARVVYVRGIEDATQGPPGIGVQFEELDPEAKERINEIVRGLRNC
ncbi:MAG: hypothetical protein A2Y95_00235 [Deltaproteobacteria bacterium RBG_13_65_10]|nr:MAG: hypothetical protein A2Y95_00235 [Deltaproteobacteria bacterium RBG_13_65_10]